MKKSLLSKLLVGVMSLGLISGGGFIQNAFAMEEAYDDTEDDDIQDDAPISGVRRNLAKNTTKGENISSRYSLEFVLKNILNPAWGKTCIKKGSIPVSTFLYTLALAKGGMAAYNEIDQKTRRRQEKKPK